MLILLSPAKTLDFTPCERDLSASKPELHASVKPLAKVAKQLSKAQVAKLMEVSDRLAETAHGYLQDWKQKWDSKRTKQAVLAFRGDVYQGLDADTLSDADLEYANDHLRILSGLYGVLRPLDLMQAYRLEMGRALKNPRGKDLYAYWQDEVTTALGNAAEQANPKSPMVVNLASNEYAKVVRLKSLDAQVISPVFKDCKNGKCRTIALFAKQARGMMARYLITERATELEQLQKFRSGGYRYDRALSTAEAPVFTRPQP